MAGCPTGQFLLFKNENILFIVKQNLSSFDYQEQSYLTSFKRKIKELSTVKFSYAYSCILSLLSLFLELNYYYIKYYAFQIALWIVFVSSKSWSHKTMLFNSEIMSFSLILSQPCQHLPTQKEMFSKKNTLSINKTSGKKKDNPKCKYSSCKSTLATWGAYVVCI